MRKKMIMEIIDDCYKCPYYSVENYDDVYCQRSNSLLISEEVEIDVIGRLPIPSWCELEDSARLEMILKINNL